MRNCWCTNQSSLESFNHEYKVCRFCQTLISQNQLGNEQYLVNDDELDFYGKQYWLSHQSEELGFADIYSRSRNDLSERNLHWLKILLKYKLPPARILELGCSHGSFVALMRQAGYEAIGVELSPWVVDFAQRTFEVPILLGPIESLKQPATSFDAIVMMDVLEHLPDPLATISHCMSLLKPDGFLLVQTPQFQEEMVYENLLQQKSPFLDVLIKDEHLYLFSKNSVTKFFIQLGAQSINFEPAIFGQYDMCFIASPGSLKNNSSEKIETNLLTTPQKRFTQAMLDLRRRELDYLHLLQNSETDRTARGKQIEALNLLLQESEADRADRGRQLETLSDLLQKSEEGRADLRKIIDKLTLTIKDCEADINTLKLNWNLLLSRRLVHLLIKWFNWPEVKNYRELIMNDALKIIAVDLTPVLPGGENGGAKIFVLELLRRLAELAPDTQFILLTQAASHEELRDLERKNMRCVQIVGNSLRNKIWFPILTSFLQKLPRLTQRLSYLGYRLNNLLKRRKAGSLLKNIGANLLFCPFTAPTFFESGIPTVCTIYDLQYKTYPEFFSLEDVAHREHTFKEACRQASMLTAISDYARQSAIQHGGLEPEKIQTIYLQMAHRIIAENTQDKSVLKRLALEEQQYLLYPANFWKHKNHEMLLTAFGIAAQEGLAAKIKLVCTGAPGPRQAWLIEATQKMNLADRVIFPGYLSDAELAVLMVNCAGLIFPSLYEGFGIPVVEAMAAGIPVACSNLTSLPEVVDKAAILFNPRVPTEIAEAMISLIEDKKLREELISAGKIRATNFADANLMAAQYWELFQLVLAERKQADSLSGAYEDGWLSSSMNIQVASSTTATNLEVDFFVPDWLPQARITVKTLQAGKKQGRPLEISRGEKASLILPLASTGNHFEIKLSPTFVPAKTGQNQSDQRELSLMLKGCRVVHSNGDSIELFSEKQSA